MTRALTHRGPDDDGVWVAPGAGLALGFRRLAIIDLSEHGHQPMQSASGRYTMIFNGEVYNFADLRRDLEPHGAAFRGHSDTEVILAAFERWGIPDATRRFVGMFAIAVWDRDSAALTLIRDRLGIKPLFLYARAGEIAFGSELKALFALPHLDRTLDPIAVTSYLRYLYVPAPRSVLQYVRKLLPGHYITIADPTRPLPEPQPYWSAEQAAREGAAKPFTGSVEEAVNELDALIANAVRLRLVSDVPLGALLSGGVDSSTVVAFMQEASSRPVKTYAIGFDDPDHNEAPYAKSVARHLGTEHTELLVTGGDALELVPRLTEMFDEPLADPSAIPTYLVCALARRDVTVALTGDGGDEVFGGYNRYLQAERLFPRLARLPRALRRTVAAVAAHVPGRPLAWAHQAVGALVPTVRRQRLIEERVRKLATLAVQDTPGEMYRSVISVCQQPETWVRDGADESGRLEALIAGDARADFVERLMLADQTTYLADDLLAKVDRASMAVSLEARVPLLDHRVVEFAWRLPLAWKTKGPTGKWILRRVLESRVPAQLVDRPKMGFTAPIGTWLRGPLREWAGDHLASRNGDMPGVLHAEPVRRAWQRFSKGSGGAMAVWAAALLQDWAGRWLTQPSNTSP